MQILNFKAVQMPSLKLILFLWSSEKLPKILWGIAIVKQKNSKGISQTRLSQCFSFSPMDKKTLGWIQLVELKGITQRIF